jgi:hypothetical protein
MYTKRNIEIRSDLHILDPSEILIPFNPLWLHFLFFTVVHILCTVLSVLLESVSTYISLKNLSQASLT